MSIKLTTFMATIAVIYLSCTNSGNDLDETEDTQAFGSVDLGAKTISFNLSDPHVELVSAENGRFHTPIRLESDNSLDQFGADVTVKNLSTSPRRIHLCVDSLSEESISASSSSYQLTAADCTLGGVDFGVVEAGGLATAFFSFGVSSKESSISFTFGGKAFSQEEPSIRCQSADIPSSEIGVWQRTSGPPGGGGYDIRAQSDDGSVIFISDIHGGIFKSTTGGDNWVPVNSGIDVRGGATSHDITIFSITVDPNDKNILWAGSIGDTAIYRSTDGGSTWLKNSSSLPPEMTEHAVSIRSFTVKPGDSNTVLVGVGYQGEGEEGERGIILKTTDSGTTWSLAYQATANVRYIEFDPQDLNTIYATTGMSDRRGHINEGVLKSTDGGSSWVKINNGFDTPLFPITGFAMHPDNPSILYAATHSDDLPPTGAIYKSTNSGATWVKIHEKTSEAAEFVGYFSIAISPKDPDTLLVGINSPQGVVKSTDAGASWSLHPIQYEGESFDYLIGLVFQPDGTTVLATDGTGGMWKSTNSGEDWLPIGKGLSGSEIHSLTSSPTNASHLIANAGGPNTIPFVSFDGGETWCGLKYTNLSGVNSGPTVIMPSGAYLNGESYGKIQRSQDHGKTWETVANTYGLSIQNGHHILSDTLINDENGDDNQGSIQRITSIAYAPSEPNMVYAGAYPRSPWDWTNPDDPRGRGIFVSKDMGLTWSKMDVGMESTQRKITSIVVSPSKAEQAIAALLSEGLWKTSNGGESWEKIESTWSPELGSSSYISSISIHPTQEDKIAISTGFQGSNGQGVFTSEDGGATWTQSTGIEDTEVVSIVVRDPVSPDTLYAAGNFSGVWKSVDNGKTFSKFNTGLEHQTVRALAITHDGTYLFAGTYGQSVWRVKLR